MNMRARKAAATLLAVLFASAIAAAAEIKVISSVGMKAALEELQPQFERATPHRLVLVLGTTAPLKRQIEGGESFDVTILTPPAALEDLARQGKVVAATIASVAKSGVGVAVAKGAPRPNLATAEAFKRTLLDARSIAYSKEGASGVAAARVIEKLGLVEEMKPRTLLETRPGGAVTAVTEGKVELGFGLVSEIIPIAGVDFAGPLPPELQSYLVFAAGVSASARDAEAAKAFIEFLRSPAALPVLRAKGMEGG